MLRTLGWRVAVVDCFTWRRLAPGAQAEWLLGLVKAARRDGGGSADEVVCAPASLPSIHTLP
jgi:hypothetical protein